MSSVRSDPIIGRRLDGRFLVAEPLAHGGMATVYRGHDTRLDRQVAIKVMNPAFSLDSGFVARFTREAQAAASINDSHVVAVYDQGDDNGVVYLVMEYVAGSTLRDLLAERGPLDPETALAIFEQLLQGLSAAHAKGFVHRDIKPENVLIRDDGAVKVSDFGLARAVSSAEASNATQGLFMGTVAYVAPEQVEHQKSDPRTDVYSAGIVLYEMVVGRPPFVGETAWNVAQQHVQQQVPVPSASNSAVPEGIDAIVLRATRKDPAARPENATVLLSQVRAVQANLRSEHPGSQPGPVAVLTTPSADQSQTIVVPTATRHETSVVAMQREATPPPPPSRRRRWRGPLALVLIIVAALVLATLAWWLGAGRFERVPGVVGMSAAQAEQSLTRQGLVAAYGDPQYSEIVPRGQVITSQPAPGGRVSRGTTVTLVLSRGPQRFDVPPVQNLTVDAARSQLQAQNLDVGKIQRRYSDTVPAGRVISSSPAAGNSVRANTAVTLVVSRGLPPVDVPNVVNKTYDNAKQALEKLGLTIAQSSEKYSDTVASGSVISQSPSASQSVPQGSTISVVVSKGPPLVLVPDVVDNPIQSAIAKLKQAGFKVEIYEPFGISPLNRVARQDPAGGAMAPRGSVIRLGII